MRQKGRELTGAAKYKPEIEILSNSENLAHRSLEILVVGAEKTVKTKDVFY